MEREFDLNSNHHLKFLDAYYPQGQEKKKKKPNLLCKHCCEGVTRINNTPGDSTLTPTVGSLSTDARTHTELRERRQGSLGGCEPLARIRQHHGLHSRPASDFQTSVPIPSHLVFAAARSRLLAPKPPLFILPDWARQQAAAEVILAVERQNDPGGSRAVKEVTQAEELLEEHKGRRK